MRVINNSYKILENVIMNKNENMMTYDHALYLLAERINVEDKEVVRDLIDVIMCNSHNAHLQSSNSISELLEKLKKYIQDKNLILHGDEVCRNLVNILTDRNKYELKEIREFFGEELLFG